MEKDCVSEEKEKVESNELTLTASDQLSVIEGSTLKITQNSIQDTALSSVADTLCEPMKKSFSDNLCEGIIIKVDESSSKVDLVFDRNIESDNQNVKQNDILKESSLNQSGNAMENSCVCDEKEKFGNKELTSTASEQEFTVKENMPKYGKHLEQNSISFSVNKNCVKQCIVYLTKMSDIDLKNMVSQSKTLETGNRQNKLCKIDETKKNVKLTNHRRDSKVKSQNRRRVIKGQGKCKPTKPKRQQAFCPYCLANVSKFNYHLEKWHSDEVDVKLFLLEDVTNVERRSIIISIRHKGYGEKFKRTKCIIPVSKYRNSGKSSKAQCKYCKGHYSKKHCGSIKTHVMLDF